MTWVNDYIGKPWKAGAGGPEAYDCYGLAAVVQIEQFGVVLPMFHGWGKLNQRDQAGLLNSSENRKNWNDIPFNEVAHGDLVLMASGQHPSHIGVWLEFDGGGILHAIEHHGVIFTRRQALKTLGWKVQALRKT